MLDRSRTYSPSPRDLKPSPQCASTCHYWLMRHDLSQLRQTLAWPSSLRRAPLSLKNAAAVYQVLALGHQHGGGSVAQYHAWLEAFENDPECDRHLCFVVEDDVGVVAVAQCWTSAFIRNLVVHPRAHRRGVGLMLLDLVFKAFARRGEGHVDLKVMESNLPARRLYERAGMQYLQRCELQPR